MYFSYGQSRFLKFDLQGVFVNFFQKPRPEFIVNPAGTADNTFRNYIDIHLRLLST